MEETNKKKAITEAFLQLVKKKPVDKITVKMVIDKCNLSRSTFYYHFRSIPELVEYILLESLEEVRRKCLKANDLKEIIYFLLEYYENNVVLIKKLGMSSQSTEYWCYIVQRMQEINNYIRKEKQEERLDVGNEEFISSVFTFGILGYLFFDIVNNKPVQVEYLAEQIVQFRDEFQKQ